TRSKRDWSSDVCSSDLSHQLYTWHNQLPSIASLPNLREILHHQSTDIPDLSHRELCTAVFPSHGTKLHCCHLLKSSSRNPIQNSHIARSYSDIRTHLHLLPGLPAIHPPLSTAPEPSLPGNPASHREIHHRIITSNRLFLLLP